MRNSADRTNSPRQRAGSRRNKKLKNVRTFATDRECYPCQWCDGLRVRVWHDEAHRLA